LERLLREYRLRLDTKLTKVIFHAGDTVELQIKKPSFVYKPGQYLLINVPEVSRFQWHPFTISSCPQDDAITIHIRIVGNWTRTVARLLGCFADHDGSNAINGDSIIPKILIGSNYDV
jgi:NADPH oxidase